MALSLSIFGAFFWLEYLSGLSPSQTWTRTWCHSSNQNKRILGYAILATRVTTSQCFAKAYRFWILSLELLLQMTFSKYYRQDKACYLFKVESWFPFLYQNRSFWFGAPTDASSIENKWEPIWCDSSAACGQKSKLGFSLYATLLHRPPAHAVPGGSHVDNFYR